MQDKFAKRFFVRGMVQGVGYRFFTVRLAERLGISGWVKNLEDGSVEVYAIGSGKALKDFRRELQRGPAGAAVDGVTEQHTEVVPRFENGFKIEHEG